MNVLNNHRISCGWFIHDLIKTIWICSPWIFLKHKIITSSSGVNVGTLKKNDVRGQRNLALSNDELRNQWWSILQKGALKDVSRSVQCWTYHDNSWLAKSSISLSNLQLHCATVRGLLFGSRFQSIKERYAVKILHFGQHLWIKKEVNNILISVIVKASLVFIRLIARTSFWLHRIVHYNHYFLQDRIHSIRHVNHVFPASFWSILR